MLFMYCHCFQVSVLLSVRLSHWSLDSLEKRLYPNDQPSSRQGFWRTLSLHSFRDCTFFSKYTVIHTKLGALGEPHFQQKDPDAVLPQLQGPHLWLSLGKHFLPSFSSQFTGLGNLSFLRIEYKLQEFHPGRLIDPTKGEDVVRKYSRWERRLKTRTRGNTLIQIRHPAKIIPGGNPRTSWQNDTLRIALHHNSGT